jgi:MFS family permease
MPRTHHLSFYGSLLLSRLADQVLLFLVPLVVYQQTGSASWTGMAFFVETLTRFVAFPVCGVLSDRHPPMRLLRQSQALRALCCIAGLVAGFALGGQPALVALVLVSAACGVFTTQGVMAREVLLPHIFPGERFERVLAHAQIADQLGMVAGPVVAAAALALWPWQGVLGCSAALFVVADAGLLWWQRHHTGALPQGRSAPGESWWVPLRTAAQHIARLPGLKPLIALAAGVNLVVGVTQATAAAMVTGWLGQSNGVYAQLQTAGAVVTVLVLAWVARVHWRGHTLGVWSYTLLLVGGLMTAWAVHPAVYALGFLLVIGFDKMFSVYIRAGRQRIIPPQDFGKTSGVVVLLNNLTQPLAGLAVGVGAQGADARGVITALVLCMAAIGGAVVWLGRNAADTQTTTL